MSELLLMTEPEHRQLLVDWNDTAVSFPADKCIQDLFEAQAEATPRAVAVVYEDSRLTYAELNAQANRLAHQLIELGVKPDTLVAICVERSLNMVIGLLAILKAGASICRWILPTPKTAWNLCSKTALRLHFWPKADS